MLQHRHLANAPITEALVDIRVQARPSFHATEFRSLREKLREQFPNVKERSGVEASFNVSTRGSSVAESRDLGVDALFYQTADGREVAQFRSDGFTFNRLAPYTSWSEIEPKAWAAWQDYLEIARPEQVTRIALRYINRFAVPEWAKELDDILMAAPLVPAGFPNDVSRFLTRVSFHEADLSVVVTQALEPSVGSIPAGIILDVDAYREQDFEPTSQSVRAEFVKLHDLKNRIFFGSLTETALREFE